MCSFFVLPSLVLGVLTSAVSKRSDIGFQSGFYCISGHCDENLSQLNTGSHATRYIGRNSSA